MRDLQQEMNRIVEAFVIEVTRIARRAAAQTLESAFVPASSADRRAVLVPLLTRQFYSRTAGELQSLSQNFASFVISNPGLRIEQINKGLGTTTKDLALPIRKLIADGVIRAKGRKRSTTYYAAERLH